MKTFWSSLRERPWLLVVLAFVLLISGWAVTMKLSGSVPAKRLTAGEEALILERRARP